MGIFSFKKSSKKGSGGSAEANSDENLPEKPLTKREQIAAKYQQIEERRQAIQEELKWLENFNRNLKKHD